MTEPELITALTNASLDARAVLAVLAQLGTVNGNVTITLSNGVSYTLSSIPKMQATYDAQFAALKLSQAQDFGGTLSAQSITRTAAGLIDTVTTTLASGLVIVLTPSRDSSGLITSMAAVIKDALGNVLATVTKTITRDGAGRYQSIS